MLAQHRYDLRFRPLALSHRSKVQVGWGFLIAHAADLGEAYTSLSGARFPRAWVCVELSGRLVPTEDPQRTSGRPACPLALTRLTLARASSVEHLRQCGLQPLNLSVRPNGANTGLPKAALSRHVL